MRAALIEHDEVVSFYFQSDTKEGYLGDLFLGKVLENRLSQVGWFISLGNDLTGFLPRNKCGNGPLPETGAFRLVQIDKEARDGKEAGLTENIQITGEHIILLPRRSYVAVSKKILVQCGERLKRMVSGWCSEGEGAIIRTAAAQLDDDTLYAEFMALKQRWHKLINQLEVENEQKRIFRQFSFVPALINENHFPSKCLLYSNVALSLDGLSASTIIQSTIQAHPFRAHHLESIYEAALQPSVPLQSGASLIIEYTETLTTIDVNSGAMRFHDNWEHTAYQINCMAAKEIAKQLRLRQIGGMILIDFLRMKEASSREKLLEKFSKYTTADPSLVHIHGYTKMGLVELTRKRKRYGLRDRTVDRRRNTRRNVDS
nr:ribonuclease E/G [Sporolactobacillus kofuensis]